MTCLVVLFLILQAPILSIQLLLIATLVHVIRGKFTFHYLYRPALKIKTLFCSTFIMS